MKISLVKKLDNSFAIAYPSDYEKAKKIKVGEIFEYETKKPRNYLFHKKFFALINLVFDNQEAYTNIDDLRYDLTIESGFFTRRTNLQGDEVKKPKSISFAKMDEREFNELYEAFLRSIERCFKFDKQDVIDNIEQYF